MIGNDYKGLSTDELGELVMSEMTAAESSNLTIPITFRPSSAFALVAIIQLALLHPEIGENMPSAAIARAIADALSAELGKIPAVAEAIRRGWEERNVEGHTEQGHEQAGETDAAAPASAGRAARPHQKPHRRK
jgi:hypothetical protein